MTLSEFVQKVLDYIPFSLRNRVKYIPGVKQIQAFIVNRYLNGEEITVAISGGPAKGLILTVKLPQDKQMWIGTWELDFAKALQKCIQPGWVCYDIGGYKGYYAGVMALKGAAKVIVFEPMPANTEMIKKMIALNASLPIQLEQVAVSDRTGKAVFKLMPEETMGKLETSSFQQNDKAVAQLTVDCISIDELVKRGLSIPDFIKIDVEGAEEFVLLGAKELFKLKKPILMIEVHSPAIGKRCLNILNEYYTNVKVLETGLTPDNETPEICHYLALS